MAQVYKLNYTAEQIDAKLQERDAKNAYPFLNRDSFTNETLQSEDKQFLASAQRIAHKSSIVFDYDIIIRCEDGYKFNVAVWNGEAIPENWISTTPWQTESYEIGANTYFTILIAKTDDDTITIDDYNKVKLFRSIDGLEGLEKEIENLGIKISSVDGNVKECMEFSAGSWAVIGVDSGGTRTERVPHTSRYATNTYYTFTKDVKISMPDYTHYSVYVIMIATLDNLIIKKTSDWLTGGSVTVPANTPFVATVQLNDNVYTITDAVEALNIIAVGSLADIEGRLNDAEGGDSTSIDTTKTSAYASLFNNSGDVESFLFFTDPHYVAVNANGGCRVGYEKHLDIIKKYYDESSAGFVLCGGDWLNNSNTNDNACYELSKIKGKMRSLFDKYYLLVGNHDTNYQGESQLTQQTLNNLWFNEYGKSYFAFNGGKTKFYTFDSGIDWGHADSLTDYDNEQIEFFLEELNKNDDKYIALAHHMVYTSGTTLHKLTERITEIAKIYNERGTVQHNGVTYDFGQKTGKVEFMIAGHSHADQTGTLNDIPYIQTINADVSTNCPTFDFVLVDYTARKLNTVRIGTGEDREIELN